MVKELSNEELNNSLKTYLLRRKELLKCVDDIDTEIIGIREILRARKMKEEEVKSRATDSILLDMQ